LAFGDADRLPDARISAAGYKLMGSVGQVLQNSRGRVGHGMMVMFDVTRPVERPCHDQVEDSAVWRRDEGVVAV
jgi:hypothetical protein